MSNADTTTEQLPPREAEEENPVDSSSSSDESSSDSDSSDEEEASAPPDAPRTLIPPTMDELLDEYPNTRETNIELMTDILDSDWYKKEQEREERKIIPHEDRFDFPKDPENWREEGLKELWADAPVEMTKPGWDPNWVDEEEVEVVNEEIKAGRDPPIQPFYVPYRKPYPVIPNDHYDIYNAKSVIEELDRIEEFLVWVSHVFEDGSTYEGTVWDDLAHGKGVYVAEQGLVRYEGEWLQNNPEGHGVIEVDIPNVEPVPGSKLEEEMRAEGRIIKRDFMSPEDREWLEMDIEDSIRLAGGISEIPFYENDLWMTQFGSKPEKGRYRYAGQWKHGRMHGCGVYEVNERPIFGRFYFGQLLEEDTYGCDANISAMHSGIAEVAAAKARMFVNKPDGMVREERGPYSDPQHPYFYEEEDVWMAPGFINQFYEVPDYWKRYVSEVDEERQMWLNSFYKAPLRLPMPPELQYWWENDEKPEFVLINKEPEPDPEDPSKLIYTEDPLILHTPTGRVINYVDDEEYGIRLFWQPPLKDGEDVDPEKAIFLPLGFDEFFGRDDSDLKDNIWMRAITGIENAFKPFLEKVEKWTEEKKKAGELEMQLIEKEYELEEAESTLEEVIQDMDEELKRMQEEEEKKVEEEVQEEEEESKEQAATELEKTEANQEEDDEEEDEEDAPSSFGSVTKSDSTDKESKNEKSPFAAASLSSAPKLVSAVPSNLLRSFSSWNKGLKFQQSQNSSSSSLAVSENSIGLQRTSLLCSVSFPRQNWSLRPIKQTYHRQVIKPITNKFRTRKYSKRKYSQSCDWVCAGSREDDRNMLLSLHTPVLVDL